VLIFPIMAVPMTAALLRTHASGRPVRLPPGFALWAFFLAAVVVSMLALDVNPVGTVPSTAVGRLLAVLFRLGQYVSLTVLLLYAGNLTEAELSRGRLVRLLGWLFVVTVAGGLLGVVAGHFAFTSPVELLLPQHIRHNSFVQSLVHPYAAQLMDILGQPSARPAAPWGYTNTWGNNVCLLVGWFVATVWGADPGAPDRPATTRRMKVLALFCLTVAVVPVVTSLNRGLWIGLGVSAGYIALRLALRGRFWAIGSIGLATATVAIALTATPLGDVVNKRLDNGKSNGVRMYLTQQAMAGLTESPIVGFGSTRNTLGGRNSITVGKRDNCERCGNFTIGGTGQLWQLIYAHGIAGTAGYLGFFGYGLWRFRRDRSAIGIAGSTALLGSFVAMLWYNTLVTPLAFMLLAYALLWRNEPVYWVQRQNMGVDR
jgi:hypothetical protein